jgi:hypothetical protein
MKVESYTFNEEFLDFINQIKAPKNNVKPVNGIDYKLRQFTNTATQGRSSRSGLSFDCSTDGTSRKTNIV